MFATDGWDADTAAAEIARLERESRRLEAAKIALLDRVDRSRVYAADGHFSARVMMRLHGQLSGVEAAQRGRVMKCLRDLAAVKAAYTDGLIGTDQVRRIGQVWANPRVREMLPVCQAEFLVAAQELEFPDFDLFCREWESRVDQEGAADKAAGRYRRRDVQLVQDYNGFWDLRGRMMSLDGGELHKILDKMVEAERLADIEQAKAEHGDEWRAFLPRTIAQLRYDTFMDLVHRGAGALPGANVGEPTADLMIDHLTFEDQLQRLLGCDPEPLDPTDRNRFSRTSDGSWVNPAEIVAFAMIGHVRRVVYDSAGVVIDMGRRQRLFTGSARDAAMLSELRCYWRGCWVPASKCQIDHLHPARAGGRTDPGNGAPACGHHNRVKEHGFHAWRDADGEWHLQRPDGTDVPDHRTHWPNAA
jgi:hypothetical protein